MPSWDNRFEEIGLFPFGLGFSKCRFAFMLSLISRASTSCQITCNKSDISQTSHAVFLATLILILGGNLDIITGISKLPYWLELP